MKTSKAQRCIEQVMSVLTEDEKQIVKELRKQFPNAADWNVIDDDNVEILDANDNLLAVTSITTLDDILWKL